MQTGEDLLRTTGYDQWPRLYSPEGSYYIASDDPSKISFHTTTSSKDITTYSTQTNNAANLNIGWANDTCLWLNRRAASSLDLLRFNGAKVTKIRSIAGTFDNAAMTSDETRIAMRDTSGPVNVYNAQTGALLGSIPALSSNAIDKLQFIAGNRLALHEYNTVASENTLRIYDVTASPVLLHKFTESEAGSSFRGAVSSTGNYFAFAHTLVSGADQHVNGSIRIYRVSDGIAVRQWNDQYLGASLSAIEFSKDDFILAWAFDSGMLVTAVVPTMVTSVSLSSTNVTGAASLTGTVTVNRLVNQDTVVHLAASSGNVTIPSTVTITANHLSRTFTVNTHDVTSVKNEKITASLAGSTASATLTINPSAQVASLTTNTADLSGNTTLDVTVHLTAPAPAGFSVPSSSNAVAITVPSSVSVPAGQSSVVITLPVKKVTADRTVTITIGGKTLQVRLHVPVPAVTAITSNKTDVTGNDTIQVTIPLDMPAPSGFSVPGSSNAAAIVVPASISIPAGQTSYVLPLAVKKVTVDRSVTITIGGKTVTITLHAP